VNHVPSLHEFVAATVLGLSLAAVYFIAASGMVVTYTTSGVFNFAHGAVAMVCAFLFWELHVQHGIDTWLAAIIVLFLAAPLIGILLERVMMRFLSGADVVTKIFATLAVMLLLLEIGQKQWDPNKYTQTPTLQPFFAGHVVHVAGASITWHTLTVYVFAVVVAVALWVLLTRSRLGIAMRAVVDDRDLTRLNGANADVPSMASWIVGCMLAALAGILFSPIKTLSISTLTLLVINAYAVAIVGRLRSLPLTALGAVILGLADGWYGMIAGRFTILGNAALVVSSIQQSLPMIMLFGALIFLPQDRGRYTERLRTRLVVPDPRWSRAIGAAVALPIVAGLYVHGLSGNPLNAAGQALAFGLVGLSLVLVTGYAGQITLAQLAFGGLGVLAVTYLPHGLQGTPIGLLVAAGAAGAAGAIVAIPCLRLQGLYLALGTMAFAVLVEKNVLGQFTAFKNAAVRIPRWSPISSNASYAVAMAVVFSVIGLTLVWLRKGEFGRRLQAMKDSPAACTTVGMDLTTTRVAVFAAGAAIAGMGGFFLAAWNGKVGTDNYSLINGLTSMLPLLLLIGVGGITSIVGALMGGYLLARSPTAGHSWSVTVAPGVLGCLLVLFPNGVVGTLGQALRGRSPGELWRSVAGMRPRGSEVRRAAAPEVLGLAAPAGGAELASMERGLGVVTDGCDAAS